MRQCISALKSPDLKRRSSAAAALSSMGRPAVPLLLEVVRGTDTAAAYSGISILGNMGEDGAQAVPELVGAINGTNMFRLGMAKDAIVKIGAPAVPAVVAELSGSRTNRTPWVLILQKIGSPAAKAIGEAALTADKELRPYLYMLLLEIAHTGNIEGALPSLLALYADRNQDHTFLPALLERIGPASVPGLIPFLKSEDAGVRLHLSYILGSICYQKKCGLDKFVPELAAAYKDPDEKIRRNIMQLIDTDMAAREKHRELLIREYEPEQKVPCSLGPASDWEMRRIPGTPEYFDSKRYISLYPEGVSVSGATPNSVSFKIPECGFSREELEKMVILHVSTDTKSEIIPVTIKDGKATAKIRAAGSFFLQMPFKAIDTLGPALKLKYLGSELTGDVAHISSTMPLEVEAVDLSSYSFAVAGIGGVYVLFNKNPTRKCYASPQDPEAPFGSNKNCVYFKPFLVPEGLQRLVVFSFDKLGNVGKTYAPMVYSDASPPKDVFLMNGTPLAPGSTVYAAATDTFTIVSTDTLPESVVPGEIKIYMLVGIQKDECDYAEGYGGLDGRWSCEAPFYNGPFTLPPGEHSVYFYSKDAVGNLSHQKQINIIVKKG